MRHRKPGFTLIELLVVIAIISVLMSLLLPALGGAKKLGRQLVSSNNLSQITLAINAYANDYDEWLVGSPETSGFECLPTSVDGKPSRFNGIAMQTYDWMGPLADYLGYRGPGRSTDADEGDEQGRANRFKWYRDVDVFQDPTNNITAVGWDGSKLDANDPTWTGGTMLPYNMSTQFTTTTKPNPVGTGAFPDKDRSHYKPQLFRVGMLSMKVAVFEGHRYASHLPGDEPDYDVNIDAGYGGAFGGVGGWRNASKEMDRAAAPGEAYNALHYKFGFGNDARVWAFRHGYSTTQHKVAGRQYMANMAFFDGHVDIFTDPEVTDPDFWFPSGTKIGSGGDFWNYAKERWPNKTIDVSITDPYVVP